MAEDPGELFDQLASAQLATDGVREGMMFGAPALKIGSRMYASLTHGALVVKLPEQRVGELIAEGTGRPFDPGMGRVMREWLAVPPAAHARWGELADEARRFVGG